MSIVLCAIMGIIFVCNRGRIKIYSYGLFKLTGFVFQPGASIFGAAVNPAGRVTQGGGTRVGRGG